MVIKAAASNGAYTLSVHDTGPGIDPADQIKIFDEFQQADNSSTKKKGGTGLGLSIARRSSPCMAVESGWTRARTPR